MTKVCGLDRLITNAAGDANSITSASISAGGCDGDTLALALLDGLGDSDTDGLTEGLMLGDVDDDGLWLALGLSEGDVLLLGLTDAE